MHNDYISNNLVHWTGRKKTEEAFDVLKSITSRKILKLSYCPNYTETLDNITTGMACFTDIHLKHSAEHCKLFGRFGVGFKKNNMISYGANPVLYTTPRHKKSIIHMSMLLENMRELEKDRLWKEEHEKYEFTEDQTLSLVRALEFFQEYETVSKKSGNTHINYYQREWRLAMFSLEHQSTAGHVEGKYTFTGDLGPVFMFSENDVEYIIVPKRFKKEGEKLILNTGWRLKIYEDEVFNKCDTSK